MIDDDGGLGAPLRSRFVYEPIRAMTAGSARPAVAMDGAGIKDDLLEGARARRIEIFVLRLPG